MLPNCNYWKKNHLMDLEYQNIYACFNNCSLYSDKFVISKVCTVCELSQFKMKIDENSVNEEAIGPLLS